MKSQLSILPFLSVLLFLWSIQAAPAAGFANGSFELGEPPPVGGQILLTNSDTRIAAWKIGTTGGPIVWMAGRTILHDFDPVDGTHDLAFNSGNGAVGAALSQSFDTVIGEDYEVTFYVGRKGDGAGTVRLTASVQSNAGQPLGSLDAIPPSHGYGTRQLLLFRATSGTTKLIFTDTSTSTISVDVLLDNVAVAPISNGEILVYRVLERSTITGHGARTKISARGIAVLDWDSGETMSIERFVLNGQGFFSVVPPMKGTSRMFVVLERETPRIVTSTVWSGCFQGILPNGVYQEQQNLLKGRDTVLQISPWRQVIFPRSFKGSPREVSEGASGANLVEAKMTFLFLSQDTLEANTYGLTASEIIDRYRSQFIAEGYVEMAVP